MAAVTSPHHFFMATAFSAAKCSRDDRTQVGACIVNAEEKIIGVGYNTMPGIPTGCNDDKFDLRKDVPKDHLKSKHMYGCSAELNAIVNSSCGDLKGCTMFATSFPCNQCAKLIVQSGIKKVIYNCDSKAESNATKAAKIIFDRTGVIYELFSPKPVILE